MYKLLDGMQVVEGSAFIAAPLGGMTLSQLGADVIRFDDIRGGIDYGRWPLAPSGRSIYWASLNKGKRSIAINLREPEAREIVAELIVSGGDNGDIPYDGVDTDCNRDICASRNKYACTNSDTSAANTNTCSCGDTETRY